MEITKEWLQEQDACASGVRWFLKQEETDSIKVLEALIADNELSDANWLIVRVMSRKQQLQYAIFAAEQVLHIFEEKYPDDNRPRLAIEAAKKVLENDTEESRRAALAAAADATARAYAYAYAAAAYALAAAADATARAYAYAAAAAAYAATAAADAATAYAADAAAARKEMRLKILNYGIRLLKEEETNG